MSKIGKKSIIIPEDVRIFWQKPDLKIIGPNGQLEFKIPKVIQLEIKENIICLKIDHINNQNKSLYGLWRTLINNAVLGVKTFWQKKLDFKGVGFKAEVQNNKLLLNVGFTNPIEIIAPDDIKIEVQKNIIIITGIDKQKVGQIAANIRAVKPVEPYKGKGIKYIDEIPRRKAGKAAKSALGPQGA